MASRDSVVSPAEFRQSAAPKDEETTHLTRPQRNANL
jgi:hypothetical protein